MESKQNEEHRIIMAYRKTTQDGRHFLSFKCPVCGGVHSHGIPAQSGFGDNDGPRGSHCREQPPEERLNAPSVYLGNYYLQETASRAEAGFH